MGDFAYTWTEHSDAVRRSDGAFIPANPLNADYAELLASAAPIAAYVAPAPPPITTVEAWKARVTLRQLGKFDAVAEAVAKSGNDAIKEAFEYAPTWHRNSPALVALGEVVGLDAKQIDDLFDAASKVAI